MLQEVLQFSRQISSQSASIVLMRQMIQVGVNSFPHISAATLAWTELCSQLFQCGTSVHLNCASCAMALFYE